MATLEFIAFSVTPREVTGPAVRPQQQSNGHTLRLPQIFWSTFLPWREANLWAHDQATVTRKSLKTVKSAMANLHAYAKWLELTDISWWHFPAREADRCLVRYRGALIDAIQSCEIAPSTAAQRIATVVRFYRWLAARRLLVPDWPMWKERQIGVRLHDAFGFNRTLKLRTTDLSIPNRRRMGERLEDGVLPVGPLGREQILDFSATHSSLELSLMLRIGFRTGMRIGSILDLKIGTLERATLDPRMPNWFRLAIGPGARPPVSTKFGVTGQVWIERSDLESLKEYVYSPRRLKRQARADPANSELIFLTRQGTPYADDKTDNKRAIHVQIGRLRRAALAQGVSALSQFHFHQTRATFATELARVALKHGGPSLAVLMVKEALLHKDDSTTLKYIKFVENGALMASVTDEFTEAFLGVLSEATQ